MDDQVLNALESGKLSVQGEFVWGSNYTFLAQVEFNNDKFAAVYKPAHGERPLWDFPQSTLGLREVAAYKVSQALGWNLVPPTVYRKKGPAGAGSLQLYVEHNPDYHYFNFSEADRQRLKPVALFDVLINNADRKGSHVLITKDDHIWLIDHGVCFHVEYKLRTVIWDFIGEPLPSDLCGDIDRFVQQLHSEKDDPSNLTSQLCEYISTPEISALANRATRLLESGRFPPPSSNHRPFPWPQI